MAKNFIVAIELGSSKITGMAGQKNLDGSITVLAVVKEDSKACIRKGVVWNIDKTAQSLTNIVKKLKSSLRTEISHVYVGVGGQSIRSVKNNIVKELPAETIVSKDMVDELMDANRSMSYPEQEILDAVTLEYKVGLQSQLDPVGVQCQRLEGNFLNILWRRAFYRNLNKCFDLAGIAIAEMYLAPLAMADSVLTEAERRSGCLLVDMGAETTTVSIYHRDILRHLAVIPLGGNNITKDIESLQIDEKDAERMKLKYAKAFTDNSDIDNNQTYPIDQERTIEQRRFVEVVEGRLAEIMENVWAQVPNEYADKLLGGIVLTGGASNMPNIEEAFRRVTRISKVRLAQFVTQTVNASNGENIIHDGTLNTVIGLLAKGDMNCAGNDITNDLFGINGEQKVPLTTGDLHQQPRTTVATAGTGIVRTEAEKQKAEEEERKRQEEERRKREEEEEQRRIEEEEERKRNSPWNKIRHKATNFFRAIVSADNEDE
ncbi:MAG: cell division protein FtsA [Prevotella sp.]